MPAKPHRLADPDEPFADRYWRQFDSPGTVSSVTDALVSNAGWMVANTLLAVIPLGLAHLLVARGVRNRWLRWITIAAFVAFLPNALYVVTDLIHLASQGTQLGWSVEVWLVLVPVYAIFVAIGVISYAASLLLVYRGMLEHFSKRAAMASCVLLHLACACGIYLGRVLRLNSWEFVTDPLGVARGMETLIGRTEAVAYVATLAIVGAALVWAALPVARRVA